jgi:protein TonB
MARRAADGDGPGKVLVAGLLIVLLAVLGGAAYYFVNMKGSGAAKKPPKISLIPNTPPPPPPPPKEEKRPEPPKEQKEMKVEQVEQKNEPPPDQSLKMEGAAGDGPSAFGGGKVGSEDLSKLGAPGVIGGSGSVGQRGPLIDPFNAYATSIKGELQRVLARKSELKRRRYGIEINVWISEDGRMARYEMLGTTQDEEIDGAIKSALAALPAFAEAPPPRMPQPVRLRIVASGRA